jgi:hypothetical protein
VKVRILNMTKVTSSISDLLSRLPPVLFQVIGRRSVKYIQEQTAKGFSVAQGDQKVSFKALSSAWIKRRKELSRFNRTSKSYQPSKSNLSFTGQLLKSLAFTVTGRRVSVGASGPRKPYKTSKGAKPGKAPTNAQVAEYVSEERPFLGLDLEGKMMVRRLVVEELKRQIRKKGF